jgi:hypothetical protein
VHPPCGTPLAVSPCRPPALGDTPCWSPVEDRFGGNPLPGRLGRWTCAVSLWNPSCGTPIGGPVAGIHLRRLLLGAFVKLKSPFGTPFTGNSSGTPRSPLMERPREPPWVSPLVGPSCCTHLVFPPWVYIPQEFSLGDPSYRTPLRGPFLCVPWKSPFGPSPLWAYLVKPSFVWPPFLGPRSVYPAQMSSILGPPL